MREKSGPCRGITESCGWGREVAREKRRAYPRFLTKSNTLGMREKGYAHVE